MSRSYDGRWTCKSMRRKCDTTRPACHNCQRRGVPCEGYEIRLRWGNGIASRGRFTGAEVPTAESIPQREKGRKRERKRFSHAPDRESPEESPRLSLSGDESDKSLFMDCKWPKQHGTQYWRLITVSLCIQSADCTR